MTAKAKENKEGEMLFFWNNPEHFVYILLTTKLLFHPVPDFPNTNPSTFYLIFGMKAHLITGRGDQLI